MIKKISVNILIFVFLCQLQLLVAQESQQERKSDARPSRKIGSSKLPIRFSGNRFIYSRIQDKTSKNPKAEKEVVEIIGNARVYRGSQAIFAHRIKVIGRGMDKAIAHGNVRVFDFKENSVIRGGYAVFVRFPDSEKEKNYILIKKEPVLTYRRKSDPLAKDVDSREGFVFTIKGEVFIRYPELRRIKIRGPVNFAKSNEYLHGKARLAWFYEDEEKLEMRKNCDIIRGDDRYRAEKIDYYIRRKFLRLEEKVHLSLYDYNLDPLNPNYKDPFQQQEKTSLRKISSLLGRKVAVESSPVSEASKEGRDTNQESPFRLRKYSVLKRYAAKSADERYRLRKFLESKTDIYGEKAVYSRENPDNQYVNVSEDALIRKYNGFFQADTLLARQNERRELFGQGNVYGERFPEAYIVFAQNFFSEQFHHNDTRASSKDNNELLTKPKIDAEDKREQWARFLDKVHMIHTGKAEQKADSQRMLNQDILHILSREIERFFESKISYLKGDIHVIRENQQFSGEYGIYTEEKKEISFLGAPNFNQEGSSFNSSHLLINLDQKNLYFQQNLRGNFLSPDKKPRDHELNILGKKVVKVLQIEEDARIWKGWEIFEELPGQTMLKSEK